MSSPFTSDRPNVVPVTDVLVARSRLSFDQLCSLSSSLDLIKYTENIDAVEVEKLVMDACEDSFSSPSSIAKSSSLLSALLLTLCKRNHGNWDVLERLSEVSASHILVCESFFTVTPVLTSSFGTNDSSFTIYSKP